MKVAVDEDLEDHDSLGHRADAADDGFEINGLYLILHFGDNM